MTPTVSLSQERLPDLIILLSQARECIVGASLTAHSRSQETDSAPQVFITPATSQHSGAGLPIVIEIREHV